MVPNPYPKETLPLIRRKPLEFILTVLHCEAKMSSLAPCSLFLIPLSYSTRILYPNPLIVSISSLPSFFLRLAMYTSSLPSDSYNASPHRTASTISPLLTVLPGVSNSSISICRSLSVSLTSSPHLVQRFSSNANSTSPNVITSDICVLPISARTRITSSASSNGLTR